MPYFHNDDTSAAQLPHKPSLIFCRLDSSTQLTFELVNDQKALVVNFAPIVADQKVFVVDFAAVVYNVRVL